MRRLSLLAVLAILLAVVGVVVRSSRTADKTFFLGGIQVNEPDQEAWVRTLDEVGMNTVAVTVYARQGDWDSANLWFDDEAPWAVNEIRVAKARGLKVVLVLRVALDHAFERNKFFWHGMIMPHTAKGKLERVVRSLRGVRSHQVGHASPKHVGGRCLGRRQ